MCDFCECGWCICPYKALFYGFLCCCLTTFEMLNKTWPVMVGGEVRSTPAALVAKVGFPWWRCDTNKG